MSEAMAHLLLMIAQHPDVQDDLVAHLDDDEVLDRVIDEALRVNPLFGIAHRVTTAPIKLPDRTLPTGSVLLFNYLAFQRTGPLRTTSSGPIAGKRCAVRTLTSSRSG